MEDNSYPNAMMCVFLALIFVFSVYTTFGYLALNIYGNEINVSIFTNFSKESGILVYGIQVLFFIVFISVMPYNFFPGKICILNIL